MCVCLHLSIVEIYSSNKPFLHTYCISGLTDIMKGHALYFQGSHNLVGTFIII